MKSDHSLWIFYSALTFLSTVTGTFRNVWNIRRRSSHTTTAPPPSQSTLHNITSLATICTLLRHDCNTTKLFGTPWCVNEF